MPEPYQVYKQVSYEVKIDNHTIQNRDANTAADRKKDSNQGEGADITAIYRQASIIRGQSTDQDTDPIQSREKSILTDKSRRSVISDTSA